jgi:hypothetical protein
LGLHDLDRRAGADLLQIADDHPVAHFYAAFHDPAPVHHRAQLHRSDGGLPLAIDDEYGSAILGQRNRTLGHGQPVLDLAREDAGADEFARQEKILRIGKFGAQFDRPGLLIDLNGEEVHKARHRIFRPVA